jgi:hypothetical protein
LRALPNSDIGWPFVMFGRTEASLTSIMAVAQFPLVEASVPSPSELFAYLLFGAIGLAAFIYGKKNARPKVLVIGIVLMAYPYVVSGAFWLYAVGMVLTAALFLGPG